MRIQKLLVLLIFVVISSPACSQNYYDRAEVKQFIQRMGSEHQLNEEILIRLFKQAETQAKVLKAIQTPAERKKEWFEYRPIFLTDARIREGVQYWQENAKVLADVEQSMGVPAEVIVAIIGVETFYGRITGNYPVFDSLVTLGFDYPKRSAFFLSELEHYLLLCKEEGFNPTDLVGSYAGAMGRAQFISSSYRRYAVDYNQDGKRDLWNSNEDAIGSVGNYLKEHGWNDAPMIATTAHFSGDANSVDESNTLKPAYSYAQLQEQGFNSTIPIESDDMLSLIVLLGDKGKEYWLGHNNFYVITRYNHSSMYAMAVFQLSQEIKQRITLNNIDEQ
jgi:membrane-bound lytic murein transglycosylase B